MNNEEYRKIRDHDFDADLHAGITDLNERLKELEEKVVKCTFQYGSDFRKILERLERLEKYVIKIPVWQNAQNEKTANHNSLGKQDARRFPDSEQAVGKRPVQRDTIKEKHENLYVSKSKLKKTLRGPKKKVVYNG